MMRRFIRLVILGLVLILVAMGSALTAMRFAIHGREVSVPQVVGLTKDQAAHAAADAGLVLDTQDKFYSSDVAEGKIVTQSPAPGSKVRRGWRLRAAESLGPQRAEIPNLVGQSARAAEINVRRRGLELSSTATARISGAEPGTIVGQDPPANSSGLVSPKISVLVASADSEVEYVMPNFVGKHYSEVVPQIQQAGMKLGPINSHEIKSGSFDARGKTQPIADGIIVKQEPAAGQKIAAGSTISFEISR
jgi:beta-lactam-binding protein with PASTA domain